ncbi:MAG TPA: VIT1/CCC1 transporter family protein [Chloroflexota bacterium]|nr:VIT1/CCC1 transporter family protein [Chloroflexota bacterium]
MGRVALHVERHFTGSETVRDVVIGMSDGLTVPFALAAGLAGAVHDHWLIVIGGLAEIAAGSIAMGMGGFLAAKSDADSYRAEMARENREIEEFPDVERQEVADVFAGYGLRGPALQEAVQAIASDKAAWVHFMMREELGLEEPHPGRALRSSLTIGGAYVAGGIIPLIPYFASISISQALLLSAIVTLIALAVFGWVKSRFTGVPAARGAGQTVLVGGLAAGVAYLIARIISGVGG